MNLQKIFSSVLIFPLVLLLLPFLVLYALSDFVLLMVMRVAVSAKILDFPLFKSLMRLLPVFFIGAICLVSCQMNTEKTFSSVDTIIVKTDSCHFALDSANFVIDELKIDYVK